MAQPIVVRCPSCSQKYRLPAEKVGMKARCRCGQRFTIANDKPIDEDTIFGWVIEGADPSSQSVLGGTQIVHPAPKRNNKPRSDKMSKPTAIDQIQATVLLERIDELGAHFEFPVSALSQEILRLSFPKQCVGCGGRSRLHVHRIVWHEKLPPEDPLRIRGISHQPVGQLHSLEGTGNADWLNTLPVVKQLPKPFGLTFPFFVCGDCSIEDDIMASVVTVKDREICQLCISNLEIAAKFLRNNGGRNTPQYAKVVEEASKQKRDRWRSLPTAVRRHINQWHTLEKGERFVAYFADSDFSRSETGKAGVVLTDKRLSFHKYSSSREFSILESGRIYLNPDQGHTSVRIVQKGRKDATVHLEPNAAEKLLGAIERGARQWKISGRARTNAS